MTERQHSIDLMPASLRARSQAGLRMGQFMAFAVISMTVTIAVATHSKIALSSAQDRLFETAGAAEEVFATEARASELKHDLDAIRNLTRQYEKLALPLGVGDVLATVVNLMPESVSVDEIAFDAGARVLGRSARARTEKDEAAPPRVLIGEISGFAANDQQIAELVSALEATPPFDHVSMDFSRGRRINDHDAREFRLSFRIDLDARYRVTHVDGPDQPSPAGSKARGAQGQEVADANQ